MEPACPPELPQAQVGPYILSHTLGEGTTGKVKLGIHRETGAQVAIKIIPKAAFSERPDLQLKVQREIALMRLVDHPNILKILEVSENQKQFGFVAEAVSGTLESDETLNGDDITYVADQMAQVLQFLHDNAHIVNLTLTPATVCVTDAIQVKLCAFNFCTPLITPEVTPQFGQFSVSKLQPSLYYTAPEYLANGVVSAASDVFSYAVVLLRAFAKKDVFDSKTVEDQYKQIEALRMNMPKITSDALAETLQQCLSFEPSDRPTMEQVAKSKGFLQLTVRSLRFIDTILTRENEDKYRFYRGLLNSIPLFSERLLKYKMLPCFIDEVLADVRYGTALVPLILTIGKKYDKPSFDRVVIKPIAHILKMYQPEELALTNLAAIPLILEMPPYHLPTIKNMAVRTWDRLRGFIVRAGALIVPLVIVLNLLNAVDFKGNFIPQTPEKSVLSSIGKSITPVFEPMGITEHNWPATVGLFTGVMAKEAIIGTLDALYADLAEGETSTERLVVLFDGKVGAFAYLLFVLLYMPCLSAMGAIAKEFSLGWAGFVMIWTTGQAYLLSTLFYQCAIIQRNVLYSGGWIAGIVLTELAVFTALYFAGKRRQYDSFRD